MTVVSSVRTSTGKLAAGAFLALSLSLAGCASTYGVGTASPNAVGQASTVYHGTVTSVREITVKRESSIIGTATGAVLGGLAGSELGGGDKAPKGSALFRLAADMARTMDRLLAEENPPEDLKSDRVIDLY